LPWLRSPVSRLPPVAGLYLWVERRLKRRSADILSLRLPPLASLERLTRRTILVSLPLLTVALVIASSAKQRDGDSFDALEAVTLLTWVVYGAFLGLRPTGRRAAVLCARRLRARDRCTAGAGGKSLHMTLDADRALAPRCPC